MRSVCFDGTFINGVDLGIFVGKIIFRAVLLAVVRYIITDLVGKLILVNDR